MKKALIIILLICIVTIVFSIVTILSKEKFNEKIFVKSRVLKNCKIDNNCSYSDMDYKLLKTNANSDNLKKVLQQINNKTTELYTKSKQEYANGNECTNVANKYHYRNIYQNIFYIYENKKIITIAVERQEIDVCTDKTVDDNVETYYFDLEKDKLISQKQLLKKYPISKIEQFIGINILHVNKEDNKNYTYRDTIAKNKKNYWVYFDYDGKAYAYYKQNIDNTYYSAYLNYKIKS